jgi:hypothetical protein
MNGTLMDKDILTSIVGNNESKAFLGIKPFDSAAGHIRKAPNIDTTQSGG